MYPRVALSLSLLAGVFTLAAQTPQPFVTAFNAAGAPVRNNYTGFVGMYFTVAGLPLSVTSLGRIYLPGNTGTHTLKLVNAVTNVDVPGTTVQITMTIGTGNTFQYAALPAAVPLLQNQPYELVSQETSGGDTWYDYWPITTTGDAVVSAPVYANSNGNLTTVANSPNKSYVPLNFQYSGSPIVGSAPSVTVSAIVSSNPSDIFSAYAVPAPGLTIGNVQFTLNGQNLGNPVTVPNYPDDYSLNYDVDGLLSGNYALSAKATDSASNSGVATPVSVAISTTVQQFVTAQNLGALRNNYGDPYGHFVGMSFTVGGQDLLITELGRYVAPGNNQTHLLKVVNASTGTDVPNGSVTVSLAGATAGQYAYGYLATPLQLSANNTYYLVSQETAGGDAWYDFAPITASASLATVNGPIYQAEAGNYVLVTNNPSSSYVPVNFAARPITNGGLFVSLYPSGAGPFTGTAEFFINETSLLIVSSPVQVDGQPAGTAVFDSYLGLYKAIIDTTKLSNGAHSISVTGVTLEGASGTASQTFTVSNPAVSGSSAFVTSFSPTFLRNNFSGFVGMQFKTGSSTITIASLGRFCSAGNTQAHTVKLVQASTGIDLAGGSVSVATSGCTAGQFVYSPLASPVTLPANTSYYLASLEATGGDQWYDFSPVTVSGVATVTGPVYFSGGWATVSSPSSSYVPVNFLTAGGGGNSGAITVAASLSGSGLTATASSTAGSIVSVQFQIDGLSPYPAITSPPYTLTLPSLSYGAHFLTAVARDSAGNIATSSAIEDYVACGTCLRFPQEGLAVAPMNNFTGTTLRNNYTGWVGFQFTTKGSLPPPVPSTLGMACMAGSTQPHFVKIVQASTGMDVITAWLNPATGCGTVLELPTFSYGPAGPYISASVGASLAPSTTYYLVIQETAGGDPWYDLSPSMPTNFNQPNYGLVSAEYSIDGPVYFNGLQYVLVPLTNYQFVGLYFAGGTALI